jgi:uncharacterized membrane protein YfcA
VDYSWLQLLLVVAAGIAAGFINTMAGGGSFLTLAALEFAGLPVTVANGTNRIAVAVQNLTAVAGFRSKGFSDFRQSIEFALPSLAGAILGAFWAININETILKRVLAGAMIMMLFILIVRPNRFIKERENKPTVGHRILTYVVFFALGIYGGAIQVAIGFLLITALVAVAGVNLVKSNMHKVFIIGTYTLFALLMFALRGEVNWVLGILMAVGNAAGAWVASRLAAEKGEKLVRMVLNRHVGVSVAALPGNPQFLLGFDQKSRRRWNEHIPAPLFVPGARWVAPPVLRGALGHHHGVERDAVEHRAIGTHHPIAAVAVAAHPDAALHGPLQADPQAHAGCYLIGRQRPQHRLGTTTIDRVGPAATKRSSTAANAVP